MGPHLAREGISSSAHKVRPPSQNGYLIMGVYSAMKYRAQTGQPQQGYGKRFAQEPVPMTSRVPQLKKITSTWAQDSRKIVRGKRVWFFYWDIYQDSLIRIIFAMVLSLFLITSSKHFFCFAQKRTGLKPLLCNALFGCDLYLTHSLGSSFFTNLLPHHPCKNKNTQSSLGPPIANNLHINLSKDKDVKMPLLFKYS